MLVVKVYMKVSMDGSFKCQKFKKLNAQQIKILYPLMYINGTWLFYINITSNCIYSKREDVKLSISVKVFIWLTSYVLFACLCCVYIYLDE